jgi:hypothetical protein
MMTKLLIVLTTGILALTLSEVAAAEDTDQNSQQMQIRQVADPAAGGATVTEREWNYLTALQKCELLVDAEKTKCVDAARKKYGQM